MISRLFLYSSLRCENSSYSCLISYRGQDGINAGKYGTVTDSFVRVVDDALKPWDSGAHYNRITVWQLGLGWPINLGWWGWTQDDVGTSVENVYLIHNQNWMTRYVSGLC